MSEIARGRDRRVRRRSAQAFGHRNPSSTPGGSTSRPAQSPLAEQLGCALDATALGPIIRVDATGRTTVPGVYAAGDAAQHNKSLAAAVASGGLAGAMAHQSLLPPAR